MSTQTYKAFVELHLIQNFSPANLNRDDTGSPKDCEFGGYRRARISSQALKRAIRKNPRFSAKTDVPVGERTKWLSNRLSKSLILAKNIEDADVVGKQAAVDVAVAFTRYYAGKKGKMDSKNNLKTNVLLYLSQKEIDILTEAALANWDAALADAQSEKPKYEIVKTVVNKEIIPRVKNRTSAPDIALFGRMLADQPDLEIDAASQVSHAISTHRVTMEMDYYTAVDELLQDEEAGAGMVGFTGFNSACFYRYACIDWQQLVDNLDNDTALAQRTIAAFLRSAIDAIPTGKQNSFAAQNPTSFALAVVRQDGMCWNLANAFEMPVQPKKGAGYVSESIVKLDALWGALADFYDDKDVIALSAYSAEISPTELTHLEPVKQSTVSAWLEPITKAI